MRDLCSYLARMPKTIFLIDGLGALLTAFLLFVVLRSFNEYFGISKEILNYLSAIAAGLCIYSTLCFLFLKANWTPFIRIIAFANLFYCIITVGLLMIYCSLITTAGITYFFVEMVIICGLSYAELNVAKEIKEKI